jgi:predicted phage gp36 major capsid-like protein
METQVSSQAVAAKARVKRLGTVGGYDVWTDEQKEKLKSMWARDRPIKQIAFDLDKSVSGVKNMRRTLKLPTRKNMGGQYKTNRVGVLVSPDELEKLRRRAFESGRTPNLYIRMLLKRDGAL